MEERENRICLRVLLFSLVGIALCLIGLIGTTWARFAVQTDVGPNTLKCADFSVHIEIINNEDQSVMAAGELHSGNYTLHLAMAISDEIDAEGYCAVKIAYSEDEEYLFYTDKLKNTDEFSFPIIVDEDVNVNVTAMACWGEVPVFGEGEDDRFIGDEGLHVTDSGVEKAGVFADVLEDTVSEEGNSETQETIEESVNESIDETIEESANESVDETIEESVEIQ